MGERETLTVSSAPPRLRVRKKLENDRIGGRGGVPPAKTTITILGLAADDPPDVEPDHAGDRQGTRALPGGVRPDSDPAGPGAEPGRAWGIQCDVERTLFV